MKRLYLIGLFQIYNKQLPNIERAKPYMVNGGKLHAVLVVVFTNFRWCSTF